MQNRKKKKKKEKNPPWFYIRNMVKSNEIFVPFFCRYSYLVVTAFLKKVTSYCNAVTCNALLQCPGHCVLPSFLPADHTTIHHHSRLMEGGVSEWVTPFLQNLFSSSFLPRAFFRFLAPLQFCSLYCWRGKKTCPSFSSPGLIYGFLQNQGVVVACLYPFMFHDISTCRKNFFHVSSLGFPMRGGIKHVRWTDRKRFCLQILYSR